jgi:hypothetical protein
MRRSRGPYLALSLPSILGSILWSILWVIVGIASPAHAQGDEPAAAEIRLLKQTAWTEPERPLIRITVRIHVGDQTIADAVVGWQLGRKVISRVQYETALDEGPTFPAAADTVLLAGDLAPGSTIEVPIRINTAETEAIEEDSGVYPLQIELRSGDQIVASTTTAVVHIFQNPPVKPVWFSWWTELATPIAFGPDGKLLDLGFETTLASGRGIVAQVEAIRDLLRQAPSGTAVDLIVSPVALDQLEQAADGYERTDGTTVPPDADAPLAAAKALAGLEEITRSSQVRMHAMPFAAPRLPALLSSPVRADLEVQWRVGDEIFERILGERPDSTVARPAGLSFDQESVDVMVARGATAILGGADTVERPPQDRDFAPPAAAMLPTSTGGEVTLLLPDPGATALLSGPGVAEDPVRAAQVLLGELATIWKEEPVPRGDEFRGLALDLAPNLPAAFWRPAVRRLVQAPFLASVQAEDLGGRVSPPPAPATLGSTTPEIFSTLYTDDLAAASARLSAFGAVVEEPAGEADRLRRYLLYAEASQYIDNEGSGRVWIDAVDGVIGRTFARLAPDTSQVLTFTSRSGPIPLRMGDPGDRVLNVTVALASSRVEFLDDNERSVTLDHPDQVITFEVEVKAAGRSSIDVVVLSPNGVVISRGELVVRSTAVNPIALVITIGAGLVLVGLWSRRLFRRRRP